MLSQTGIHKPGDNSHLRVFVNHKMKSEIYY